MWEPVDGSKQPSDDLTYAQGFEDGLRAFAWWKDGVQYVGSCGTTLTEALCLFHEGTIWSDRRKHSPIAAK